MAPKTFKERQSCSRHGCKSSCPFSAIVRGYETGERARCFTCNAIYKKPDNYNKMAAEQGPRKPPKGGAQTNGLQTVGAVDAHIKEKKELRAAYDKLLQEHNEFRKAKGEANGDGQAQAPIVAEDPKGEDIDKQIASKQNILTSMLANDVGCPKELIAQFEQQIQELKAKKHMAKPLSTRLLNANRKVDKDKAAYDKAVAEFDAEQKRHREAVEKRTKQMEECKANLQKSEADRKQLQRELAQGEGNASPTGTLGDAVVELMVSWIPSELKLMPHGERCFEEIKGAVATIQTNIEIAKDEHAQKQAQAAAISEQVAAVVAPQSGAPAATASASALAAEPGDTDFEMLGEDQRDDVIATLIGEWREESETAEQYDVRKQLAKRSWAKAHTRVRDCKSKQANK